MVKTINLPNQIQRLSKLNTSDLSLVYSKSTVTKSFEVNNLIQILSNKICEWGYDVILILKSKSLPLSTSLINWVWMALTPVDCTHSCWGPSRPRPTPQPPRIASQPSLHLFLLSSGGDNTNQRYLQDPQYKTLSCNNKNVSENIVIAAGVSHYITMTHLVEIGHLSEQLEVVMRWQTTKFIFLPLPCILHVIV